MHFTASACLYVLRPRFCGIDSYKLIERVRVGGREIVKKFMLQALPGPSNRCVQGWINMGLTKLLTWYKLVYFYCIVGFGFLTFLAICFSTLKQIKAS